MVTFQKKWWIYILISQTVLNVFLVLESGAIEKGGTDDLTTKND